MQTDIVHLSIVEESNLLPASETGCNMHSAVTEAKVWSGKEYVGATCYFFRSPMYPHMGVAPNAVLVRVRKADLIQK